MMTTTMIFNVEGTRSVAGFCRGNHNIVVFPPQDTQLLNGVSLVWGSNFGFGRSAQDSQAHALLRRRTLL